MKRQDEGQERCGRRGCRHVEAAHVQRSDFDDGYCLRPGCRCPGFVAAVAA